MPADTPERAADAPKTPSHDASEREAELAAIKQESWRTSIAEIQQVRSVYMRSHTRTQQGTKSGGKDTKKPIPTGEVASTPIRLDEKRDALAQARRRKIWRFSALVFTCVAVVALIAIVLLRSPLLAYQPQDTKVVGASATVPAQAVREQTKKYAGKSLLLVRPGTVSHELETALPWVESAQVQRSYPHGLTITVSARKPVAQLPGKAGYLDASGKVLPVVAGAPQGLIPIVGATNATQREAGAEVAKALASSVRKQVLSVNVKNPDSIVVELTQNRTLKWGDAQESDIKARVARVLLTIEAKNYSVIDPRHPLSSAK